MNQLLEKIGGDNFYLFEEQRLKSFKCWPFKKSDQCNINKMAEAGFYWSGTDEGEDDCATCFNCFKVLDGWESTDDPWTEHMKHAPQCAFVKLGKPEKDITVEEFLDLFASVTKNILIRKENKLTLQFKRDIEKKRENFCK